jgi:hypothetical protein
MASPPTLNTALTTKKAPAATAAPFAMTRLGPDTSWFDELSHGDRNAGRPRVWVAATSHACVGANVVKGEPWGDGLHSVFGSVCSVRAQRR